MTNPFITLEHKHPKLWSILTAVLLPGIAIVSLILTIFNILENIFTDVIIPSFKDSWDLIKANFNELITLLAKLTKLINTNWNVKGED